MIFCKAKCYQGINNRQKYISTNFNLFIITTFLRFYLSLFFNDKFLNLTLNLKLLTVVLVLFHKTYRSPIKHIQQYQKKNGFVNVDTVSGCIEEELIVSIEHMFLLLVLDETLSKLQNEKFW